MLSNSAGALPHCATLNVEANERCSWLLTHYAPGGSQSTGKEGEMIVRAVQSILKVAIVSTFRNMVYPVMQYSRTLQAWGMETPLMDVFESHEAPKL